MIVSKMWKSMKNESEEKQLLFLKDWLELSKISPNYYGLLYLALAFMSLFFINVGVVYVFGILWMLIIVLVVHACFFVYKVWRFKQKWQ